MWQPAVQSVRPTPLRLPNDLMGAPDLLLALLALGVGVYLAWGSGPVARVLLFATSILVAAMLFLPGSQLSAIIGADTVAGLKQAAAHTPWGMSEWLHFGIFVWLGLVVWLGRPDLRGWKAVVLVAGLAVAAEVAQGLAPERAPRVGDVVLNLAGGFVGLSLGVVARVLMKSSGVAAVNRRGE